MLNFLLGVAITAAIYGIAAVSLNLQAGGAGLLNFGQVGFFGIGAYAAAIAAHHGAPWVVGIAAGMLLAALAGAGVGLLGRTLSAEYWAIVTLALAGLLYLVALNADALTGGAQGIGAIPGILPGLGVGTGHELGALVLVGAILAGSWLISQRLLRIQFGRSLRLLREQPDLAAALGHNVVRAKVWTLAISAPMAALAGSLSAHYLSYVGPSQMLPLTTFLLWTMMVVGGMGNGLGVIVGAFAIQLISEGSRFLHDVFAIPQATQASLRILLVGLALLGFLTFRPSGLVPEKLRRFHAPRS